jgi:hypothetical protein
MREEHIQGDLQIKPPSGSAFGCETPPAMPKLHQACLVVGPRGSGKSTATVNLIERLPFDRIFVISPSMKSNKELMDRLKIDPQDVYEDPDDVTCLDSIKAAIEAERDDLERYREELKRYRKLMKTIHSESSLFRLSDDDLADFFQYGDFQPPKHRWNDKKPCMCLILDDVMGSMLYSKPRKLNQLTIYHRHLGQLKEGGALGLSLFFLVQSYKAVAGGISRTIRGNVTSMILFANKNQKMLDEVAEELAGEVSPEVFHKVFKQAIQDKHDFLFVDLHRKPNHPSPFRRNLDTFLIPE